MRIAASHQGGGLAGDTVCEDLAVTIEEDDAAGSQDRVRRFFYFEDVSRTDRGPHAEPLRADADASEAGEDLLDDGQGGGIRRCHEFLRTRLH